jgi:hypothetical protein
MEPEVSVDGVPNSPPFIPSPEATKFQPQLVLMSSSHRRTRFSNGAQVEM